VLALFLLLLLLLPLLLLLLLLLCQVPAGVPVSILWGADDPWEDMKEGRRLFAHYPCVTGVRGLGVLEHRVESKHSQDHTDTHTLRVGLECVLGVLQGVGGGVQAGSGMCRIAAACRDGILSVGCHRCAGCRSVCWECCRVLRV
jgi:hypothetical protein